MHQGYYFTINKWYDDIKDLIEDKNVILIGHSKAGGEVQLLSDMLQTRSDFNCSSIAFDPPRITDKNNIIPNNNIFIFSTSIVPRIPFKIMGYKHAGKKFYYNRHDLKNWLQTIFLANG